MVVVLGLAACSIFNRDAPDATCDDLEGRNACANGIIASCPDGRTMQYEVCTIDANGSTAEQVCEAAWQCPGAYACLPSSVTCAEGGGGSGPVTGPVLQVDHVTVNDGPQGDGVLNPGETGWVSIFVKNTGDTNATNVGASLSFEDVRVEVIECSSHSDVGCCTVTPTSCSDCRNDFDSGGCGTGPDVAAGTTNELYAITAAQLTVAEEASDGQVAVSVVLTSAEGSWDDLFALDVVGPQNAGGGSP